MAVVFGLLSCEAVPLAEPEEDSSEHAESLLAPVSPEILELLPEEVRYRRVPLPEEKNAYALWVDAAERAVKPEDREAVDNALTEVESTLTPQTLRQLELWIERNAAALASLEAGLELGGFQLPEEAVFGNWNHGSLAHVLRAKLLRAKFLARAGRHEQAARDLRDVLRVAELVQQGDTGIRAVTISGVAGAFGCRVIRFLASRKDVSQEVLEGLRDALGSQAQDTELFVGAVRSELCVHSLPLLADGLPKEEEIGPVLEWLSYDFMQGINPETLAVFREVLEGHPEPFDLDATFRLAGDLALEVIRAGRGPWKRDGLPLLAEIEESVEALSPFRVPWEQTEAQKRAEQEKFEAGRKALATVENPIGKVLVVRLLGGRRIPLRWEFNVRTQREATRAVLALRLFAMRTGELPGSLDQLIEAQVLPAVPLDPFSGKALNYSREKRLLWSVGTDGEEKGDQGAWDEAGEPRPYAWEVPNPEGQ